MSELVDWLDLKGAQKDAVEARGVDIMVSAGAGSGKTRTLVARYMTLLAEGLLPQQIIAITFTEKAAREMRNRIRAAIRGWRGGPCPAPEKARWEEIEADIDAARIGTIHSLCASLIRSHPAEATMDPMASVLEEGLSAVMKARAVDDTLVWATGQVGFKTLFEAFKVSELGDILSKLLASRLEARPALQTGLSERWNRTVLEELTNFARDDEVAAAISTMRGLRDSGLLDADAGDKLGVQIRGLLRQWEILEGALASGEHIAAAQALYTIRRDHSALNIGRKASAAKEALRALRERYESLIAPWLKDMPDAETERRVAEVVGLIRELFEKVDGVYRSGKARRQAVDFDDLEDGAARLLENVQVRARWQRQIAVVLVDEFQDTNERQRRIVEGLAGIPEGRSGRLFVVGDAKQSIYRFRGADVAVFQQLKRDILDRSGQSIELDLTFRAHDPLVRALNELLDSAMMGNGDNFPGRVAFSPLRAERSQPQPGIAEPYIEFLLGLGETSETARPIAAKLLARRLFDLHDHQGVKWEEVALLFRASAGFPAYEAALEEAGIPFITVAGRGFYDRPEVRDLLNILGALADSWDDLAMAGLLRSPAFGLSDAALYQLRWPVSADGAGPLSFRIALRGSLTHLSEADRQKAERARGIVDHLSSLVDRVTVAELIKEMIDKTLYRAILSATDSGLRLQRNVDKLLADASASGLVRVTEFLEYIGTLREGGAREGEAPAEAGGAVRLMTVHRAKGLEFPVVVIADASRSRPPSSGPALLSSEFGFVPCPSRFDGKPLIYGRAKALDDAQSEYEDRRVLYVAATRAREKLLICGHQSGRQSKSWMATLAEAAGWNLGEVAARQGEQQVMVLPLSRQKIAALAECTISERGASREPVSSVDPERPDCQIPSLLQPIVIRRILESEEEGAITPEFQIRRISRRHHVEGAIVGSMVHEAIRRWCFPGNPSLDRLLHTAAFASGLAEAADIAEHVRQASLLLARLQRHSRWQELDSAERRHEVPYTVLREGMPSLGVIDLLYRCDEPMSPGWCIVDFKTDRVSDEAEFGSLIDRYSAQIRRYRDAVASVLKGTVKTTLCFLDYCGGVRWEDVR